MARMDGLFLGSFCSASVMMACLLTSSWLGSGAAGREMARRASGINNGVVDDGRERIDS